MKRFAVVNEDRCVSCCACTHVCPRQAISIYKGCFARVDRERCIGCGLCMKNCSHEGAIKIDKFLAIVNPEICKECDDPTCLTKCPTKAIQSIVKAAKNQKTA